MKDNNNKLQKFEQFNESKEEESIDPNAPLSKEERDYLFNKIEYRKKQKAIEQESKIYQLLKGDQETFSDEEKAFILRNLEYSFKKRLKQGPPIRSKNFKSVKVKLIGPEKEEE